MRSGLTVKRTDGSGVQVLGVVLDVVVHERVDEEIAVVVALQEDTQCQS